MKMTDLSTTPEATRRACRKNVSKQERVYQTKDERLLSVDITSEHFYLANTAVHIAAIRDITDKKHAEKALKSNYSLLQIAGETAIFGGWSVDLENNICTWSDAVADIHDMPHGYAPPLQEAINFYAPEWREMITQVFSACTKEGIPYDEEMEIITPKEKRVWVRTTGKAVKNEKGKIIKVQGSFQDITERKQAEEKLAHSQKLMQYIIEHTNSAVAVHDRNMHYIYVSQRYLDDYKVNENDIIGKHHYDVFPDLPQKWRDVHQKALAGEISKADRDPYFRDDGTIEWTRWECRPWYEENGSIGGIIVYTEVITDWINAQEKLRISHERMLTILDSIDSTVYVSDMDTCEILFMNKRMITDFGGDKTGDICYSAFRKNSEPCEFCTNDQLVDKHGNPAGVRIWHDKKPVTGRYYINYDRAIVWTDGRLVRMQIATDITDLKKMEAQLLQAQKMESTQIDQILANLCINARDAIDGVGKLTIETGRKTFDEAYCSDHLGFIPGDFVLLAVSDICSPTIGGRGKGKKLFQCH